TVGTAYVAWGLGDIGVGMMAWLNIIAIVLLHKKAFVSLKDYETQNAQGLDPQFDPVRLGIKNADYWLGERKDEPAANPGQTTSVVREQSAGKLSN
ncbi:alanine:cation symporter family protein, partial [Enterobacter kobei]|uniref:alanine:cation symporter family protein n=1 Tax=Enterobacter kobei TaxID=208224 RepID=UPI003D6FAB83